MPTIHIKEKDIAHKLVRGFLLKDCIVQEGDNKLIIPAGQQVIILSNPNWYHETSPVDVQTAIQNFKELQI